MMAATQNRANTWVRPYGTTHGKLVGADPCVCPNDGGDTKQGEHTGSPLRENAQE